MSCGGIKYKVNKCSPLSEQAEKYMGQVDICLAFELASNVFQKLKNINIKIALKVIRFSFLYIYIYIYCNWLFRFHYILNWFQQLL